VRLNVERELPPHHFDVAFGLGLLEYLRDPEQFVKRLADACSTAVVSYVVSDAEIALPPDERKKRGWLTNYTKAEVEQIFEAGGFARKRVTTVGDGATGVWLWITASARAS
jgi:hypothetical protein